jgi:hypothetical protein
MARLLTQEAPGGARGSKGEHRGARRSQREQGGAQGAAPRQNACTPRAARRARAALSKSEMLGTTPRAMAMARMRGHLLLKGPNTTTGTVPLIAVLDILKFCIDYWYILGSCFCLFLGNFLGIFWRPCRSPF